MTATRLNTFIHWVGQSESSTSTRLESSANKNRARPESAALASTTREASRGLGRPFLALGSRTARAYLKTCGFKTPTWSALTPSTDLKNNPWAKYFILYTLSLFKTSFFFKKKKGDVARWTCHHSPNHKMLFEHFSDPSESRPFFEQERQTIYDIWLEHWKTSFMQPFIWFYKSESMCLGRPNHYSHS